MTDRDWCPTMPPWVRRIPVGRGHDLNVMARTILEGLWFCAPVSRAGEMFTGPVDLGRWTPTISELAEANGVTEVSARKARSMLISVGWITQNGRRLVLAWMSPGNFGDLADRSSRIGQELPEDRSILEDHVPEDHLGDPRGSSDATRGSVKVILEDRSQLTTPHPLLPQPPPSGSALQPGLFGDDVVVEKPTPGDVVTPAKIRAWWAEVYLPLRAETLDRYRPGSAQAIACSDTRMADLRKRISDAWHGLPWSEVSQNLTHVVRNAAARVHEHGGSETPWGWNSQDAIAPKHWTAAKNFVRYYEQPPAYGDALPPGEQPLPEPRYDDPRYAHMQAHELEREFM
jgi:hypothetical protein